jgi:ferredoxin-NADP reductase
MMPNPIKLHATVHRVLKHSDGVYTVIFVPEKKLPKFKPGQFLHLTVDPYDPAGGFWPESRVFSIASPPGADIITIVYSVKGIYTCKMEDRLKPGTDVWIKLPYGDFVINTSIRDGQDVVLVAGGTGISPFIPYLEDLVKEGASSRRVTLHYGTSLCSQVLFPELLERCTGALASFDATIWIENEALDNLHIRGIRAKNGRLSIEAIHREAKELKEPVFFLSGPPTMIRNFRQGLIDQGVSIDNIKIDEWE